MTLGPELFELEGLFNRIIIKPLCTYIVCKKPKTVIDVLKAYDVGDDRSIGYTIITEAEAIKRGLL